MKRTFRRLNEVRETESDLKAAQYLANGFEEITKEKPKRGAKGNQKGEEKEPDKKETQGAGGVNDNTGETKDTPEPDGSNE
ncbi:MAG: hypothetical protein IJF50_08465 [Peptococcaceae bacterium]|nr:hypothetical protein [Peptococcaceae bacterium]